LTATSSRQTAPRPPTCGRENSVFARDFARFWCEFAREIARAGVQPFRKPGRMSGPRNDAAPPAGDYVGLPAGCGVVAPGTPAGGVMVRAGLFAIEPTRPPRRRGRRAGQRPGNRRGIELGRALGGVRRQRRQQCQQQSDFALHLDARRSAAGVALLPCPAVGAARFIGRAPDVSADDGAAAMDTHAARPAGALRVALPRGVLFWRVARPAAATKGDGGFILSFGHSGPRWLYLPRQVCRLSSDAPRSNAGWWPTPGCEAIDRQASRRRLVSWSVRVSKGRQRRDVRAENPTRAAAASQPLKTDRSELYA
jgi:hypothetical protein